MTPANLPSIPITDSRELEASDRVFAIGYPLGMETVSVTSGSVVGFVPMVDGASSAWIRTDARFNRGNSGGMLVDSAGNLVGIPTLVMTAHDGQRLIEPIELARPSERVPAEWLAALQAGHIDDVRIDGLPSLRADRPLTIPLTGEVGPSEDLVYYVRVETDRPGVVRGPGDADLTFFGPEGGDSIRGLGSVSVGSLLGSGSVRVIVDRPAAPRSITLRFAPAPNAPAPPPPSQSVHVEGAVALGGVGAAALVVVAREGVDLRARLAALAARRITQAELDADVIASARADQDGQFGFDVARGGSYPIAFVMRGARAQTRTLRVGPLTSQTLRLPPVILHR